MINQLGVKVVSIGFIFDVHNPKQHPKASIGTVPHAKLNNYFVSLSMLSLYTLATFSIMLSLYTLAFFFIMVSLYTLALL